MNPAGIQKNTNQLIGIYFRNVLKVQHLRISNVTSHTSK